jgi:hypothetical protein
VWSRHYGDSSPDAAELGNMTNPLSAADDFRISAFTPAVGFDSVYNLVFDVTVTNAVSDRFFRLYKPK